MNVKFNVTPLSRKNINIIRRIYTSIKKIDVYLRQFYNKRIMVLAKNELFNKEEQQSATLFKALAHPARIQILKYLAETKTCISGDISKELPLGRTTVNQHLKELKNIGLIQGHVTGSKTNYCLDPVKVKELKAIAEKFFEKIDIDENINCK